MDNLNILGASIEDTYVSAGLVNLENRQVVANTLRRKRINPRGSAEEIITAWSNVLKEVIDLNQDKEVLIGLGLPEQVEYESGVFFGSNPDRYGSLYKTNLKAALGAQLQLPASNIKLLNDAQSFFQGEVFAGAIRGYKNSFGLTLGVGLGSARYFNGVVEDANLWKMPFRDSIAEDYLSVRWLTNRFQELSGIEVLDLVEMKRFAPDANVDKTFAEFGRNLGEFLAQTIQKENPEVLLIGGHMESSNRFFFNIAIDYVQSQGIKTPVMKAILGEKASIIGAASSWYERLLHT